MLAQPLRRQSVWNPPRCHSARLGENRSGRAWTATAAPPAAKMIASGRALLRFGEIKACWALVQPSARPLSATAAASPISAPFRVGRAAEYDLSKPNNEVFEQTNAAMLNSAMAMRLRNRGACQNCTRIWGRGLQPHFSNAARNSGLCAALSASVSPSAAACQAWRMARTPAAAPMGCPWMPPPPRYIRSSV